MTTSTATRKSVKTVQVIARYELKRNGHVVYKVRSSDGQNEYQTTLVNGKATGCDCASRKPCYHMTQLEAKEAARSASSSKEQEAKETAASYARMFYSGI